MYSTFTLRELPEGNIQGYRWHRENPEKIICIIHGIGEYGGRYDRVSEKFRQAGCEVYAMDLRGHGDSMGKRGHCAPREDILEDISALLSLAARTHPGKKIILYGHSLGGNITLDYRCRGAFNDLPAAYLISAPWIHLVRPIPIPVYYLVRTFSLIRPSLTIGANIRTELLGNPEMVGSYSEDPMIHSRISLQCAAEGFEIGRKLEQGKMEDNGKATKIPIMIMHGENDQICDIGGSEALVEHLREQNAPVSYRCWPGLCHEIHNGGQESTGDEVIEAMIDFFGSIR